VARRSKEDKEKLLRKLLRAWKSNKYIRDKATLTYIGEWLDKDVPLDHVTVKRWLKSAGHDVSRFRAKRTAQQIADILGESVSTVESNYDKYAGKARKQVYESQEVEGVTRKQYIDRKQYLKRRLLSLADAYGYDVDKIVSKVGKRSGTLDDWVNSKYLREIFEPILGGQKEYSDFFSIKNADISADNYNKVIRFNKLLSDAFPVSAEDFKDYGKWDDLLSDARKKAKHNFDSHMRKAGPRALAMLKDPAKVDYVFNMFLRAQIESLANKTPIKHLSHGAASFGPNSSGLTNAFNYFLEDASVNTARGSAPVLENSPAYKLLRENQEIYGKFRDLPMGEGLPKAQAGLWGDLKITDPKWKGQSIPFMSLSNEVKQTALNNAERARDLDVSKLRAVEPGKQLSPSGLMKFGKGFGRKLLSLVPGIGMPLQYSAIKGYQDDPNLSKEAKNLQSAYVMAGLPGLIPELFGNPEETVARWKEGQSNILQGRQETRAEIDARRKKFQSTWRGGNNIWNQ